MRGGDLFQASRSERRELRAPLPGPFVSALGASAELGPSAARSPAQTIASVCVTKCRQLEPALPVSVNSLLARVQVLG